MKKLKNMTQVNYDRYLVTTILPEIEEEFGEINIIILKKTKLSFARTCRLCGDFIKIDKEIDLCNEVIDVNQDALIYYLETLTGYEVVLNDTYIGCDCYDDGFYEDAFISTEEDEDVDTDIDFDEDYDDGNHQDFGYY